LDELGASNGYSTFLDRLPLYVARIIGASTFERKDVVDDVTRAGTGCDPVAGQGVTGPNDYRLKAGRLGLATESRLKHASPSLGGADPRSAPDGSSAAEYVRS
jgi:hypothetical protein